MTIDPAKEIRNVFARAVLEHEGAKNLNPEEWAVYQKIQRDHGAQVRFEERQFELEYQTRFEVARSRIIDRGGVKDLKLVHRWLGNDKFNAVAIDRQADREVRAEHSTLLARLEQERQGRVIDLLAAAEKRHGRSNHFKEQFERAADRRSGQERRRGPER